MLLCQDLQSKFILNIKMLLILIAKIERWASLLEEMQNPTMNEINIFSSLKSFVRIDQWLFDIVELIERKIL